MHFCSHGGGDAGRPLGRGLGIGGEVWPRAIWWIGSGVVALSTRMGPPLTESPGQCRGCEQRRAGSPRGQTRPHAAANRVLKGWREQGHGIGCRPGALLTVARFRERPAMNAGQATANCATKNTSGPPPQGRRHRRFETGASRAGNDCDACSLAMSKGQEPFGRLQWTPGTAAVSTRSWALPPPSGEKGVCLGGR